MSLLEVSHVFNQRLLYTLRDEGRGTAIKLTN